MKVTLLRGHSGSGKSTLAKSLGGAICSADHYFSQVDERGNETYKFDPTKLFMAHSSCMATFDYFIREKTPFIIVDNTNTTIKEMDFYYQMAVKNGYEVEIIECYSEFLERNVHRVPRETVLKQIERIKNNPIPKEWNVSFKKVET